MRDAAVCTKRRAVCQTDGLFRSRGLFVGLTERSGWHSGVLKASSSIRRAAVSVYCSKETFLLGIGKRPNQHYLPSGCRAMLRLNYSFAEQVAFREDFLVVSAQKQRKFLGFFKCSSSSGGGGGAGRNRAH